MKLEPRASHCASSRKESLEMHFPVALFLIPMKVKLFIYLSRREMRIFFFCQAKKEYIQEMILRRNIQGFSTWVDEQ